MLNHRHSAAKSLGGRALRSFGGFSLIELVVAMAILVTLLAAVMPEVSSWIKGLKVSSAAESLRNGAEIARMEALKRNSRVSFWLVADGTAKVPGNTCVLASDSAAWVVSVVDPTGACAAEASLVTSPQLVQRSTATENTAGLTVEATSLAGGAGNHVTFNGLGQVAADGSTVSVIDVSATAGGTRRLRVVVETGGAIRMCDRDVAAGDPRICPVL
ncbi:GspH/FimT family pseudopilin [Roseateles oligotrophus]|uniref:Type II secretion system protein H n=1 Tax=Roseateles oligotrophus TaxID=1769250 RepID=A0ABT2YEN3_9BURK|nr:GspH/FimT family pseudopilin [Roseateles oligotrophus]MCV2368512.1 GspH/FimT family pseudopilin [Roseateles oligotrophus]